MKSKISTIFVAALLIFSFVPVIAYAVEDSTTTEDTPTPTPTSTVAPTDKETAKAEREARLEKRVIDLKTRLTTAQKNRLKAKCKASQGKISSVSGRVNGIETSRTKVHAKVVKHLEELSTKLNAKSIDTATLDASIVTLKEKITTFETDLAAFKLALTDLAEMDCETDPDGFQASLETARAARKLVQEDSQAIKAFVKESIKPLLVGIRAQLEPKTEGSNE